MADFERRVRRPPESKLTVWLRLLRVTAPFLLIFIVVVAAGIAIVLYATSFMFHRR